MARRTRDKQNLKSAGEQVISDRQDLVLAGDESTGADNGISFETGGSESGGICQAVIDKKSGYGYVCITDASGYVSPEYRTGPDQEAGYMVVDIAPGQRCMRYGSCAVLYILRS
ncbi:hypothetical protein ONS95_014792 [Cadophora gregata]|uniref:uncharacterized protein n=1 Tax=Cadophora gregata TaxID=51156 RepID=UPI0026DDBC23|nr:uncharacterized protein ONS95_014792 [Cadophora gregata]KAK0113087.1 hypothetical protein ONS95_014792 [Cadophora gregata]